MSPKIDEKINVLTPAAEEPITDYEMVMAKIDHDAHVGYKGVENAALKNKDVKKQSPDEVET
ncbi:MAG: hypothetical protein APF77_04775 [Clostridia bacterium BRH_c25]|nr:MAG: hypothetical protein APF77_04775 [Clostridia bacterium BRH_c25]